jgi:hypothetical protein
MCNGAWALFEGSELHSLWSSRDELLDFMEEQQWLTDPEYHFKWIRIED